MISCNETKIVELKCGEFTEKGYCYMSKTLKNDVLTSFAMGRAKADKKASKTINKTSTNNSNIVSKDKHRIQCTNCSKGKISRATEHGYYDVQLTIHSQEVMVMQVVCSDDMVMYYEWFKEAAKYFYQRQALRRMEFL